MPIAGDVNPSGRLTAPNPIAGRDPRHRTTAIWTMPGRQNMAVRISNCRNDGGPIADTTRSPNSRFPSAGAPQILERQKVGGDDQPEGGGHSTLQRRKRRQADDPGMALEPDDNRAHRQSDRQGVDHAGQHASPGPWRGIIGASVGAERLGERRVRLRARRWRLAQALQRPARRVLAERRGERLLATAPARAACAQSTPQGRPLQMAAGL